MPHPSALGLLALSASLFAPSANAEMIIQAGPNTDYLTSMCYPLYSNVTRLSEISDEQVGTDPAIWSFATTLSQSPFPCEQMLYLEAICRANGTAPIDFAAEQQCLCAGNYFAASTGCADCYFAHGAPQADKDAWNSVVMSLSTAECAPATPTVPFMNLRPIQTSPYPTQTSTFDASYVSSADRLRSKTAVSAYYTGGAVPTPGAITGDATGRLRSFTNTYNVIFTPTGAKSTSGTTGVPAGTTSGADAAVSTTETGAAAQRTAAGRLAAMVVGAVMML